VAETWSPPLSKEKMKFCFVSKSGFSSFLEVASLGQMSTSYLHEVVVKTVSDALAYG